MVSLNLFVALLCVSSALAANNYQFGTYERLFSAQSLWNSRPVNPIFSNDSRAVPQPSINKGWFPSIATGAYSTGVFLAKDTDLPVTVYAATSKGLNNIDAFEFINNITIPRWPTESVPASGTDGHLDIVDTTTGIIHSFWQLSQDNVTLKWVATQYAWSPLNGLGWGDAGHYYQGARAAGVPTSGGIIRKHEIDDSNSIYYHALAMSLAHNSLGFNPTFVYPATNADSDAAAANSGYIPEGALLMLPPSYNTSKHDAYPKLKKVAETLKVYGAYVVDRNTATPFAMYVENGATWRMSNSTTWDGVLNNQLDDIRKALRMVESADYYLDGNEQQLIPAVNVNMLSMRSTATWSRRSGDAEAFYDTWTQSLVYSGSNTQNSTHSNTNSLGYNRVSWGKLQANKTYTFSVESTGTVYLQIQVLVGGNVVNQSQYLTNGESYKFPFPTSGYLFFSARKPAGGPASIRGKITIDENIGFPKITDHGAATTNAATTNAATTTGPDDDKSSNAMAMNKGSVVLVLLVVVLLLLS